MTLRPLLALFLILTVGIVASLLLFPTLSTHSGPPDVTTADTPTIDPSVPDPYQGTKAEPTVVIQVGDTGNGLPIQVWNAAPTKRTVSVKVVRNDSDSSVVTRTETLPPNGTLRLEIPSPGYLVAVTDEATQTTETYPVTTAHFDCNSRFAEVRIDGNGTVDSGTVSTSMGC